MIPMLKRAVSGLSVFALLALAVPLLAQDSPPAAKAEAGDDSTAGGSAFIVTDLAVDVSAKSAELARVAAFREAARLAWPELWARMTGTPMATAPKLPDSAIEGMVSGIEVQRERFSATRYIATLGVVFDRNRAGMRLPASARILQSAPMLLLPLLVDGGVASVFEARSPWQRAWARFGTDSTPIDYVRASGSAADGILLTGWQARRDDRPLWRSILTRYNAENVLVAEAQLHRLYPGGPIEGTFLARHGPDSIALTRFRLRARAAGELDAMLDVAVRRIDAAYAKALQTGQLKSDPALTEELMPIDSVSPIIDTAEAMIGTSTLLLSVATPDAETWNAIESSLRSVAEIDGVALVSLSVGGSSQVRINHSADLESLRYALDQRGLRIDGNRLRRRAAGEAPLALPTLIPEDDEIPVELLPQTQGDENEPTR